MIEDKYYNDDRIRDEVAKIHNRQMELYKELEAIQNKCPHNVVNITPYVKYCKYCEKVISYYI